MFPFKEFEELNNAFNCVVKALDKVIEETIALTEKDLGRVLTNDEKEFCVKVGVPICFLKALEKGD